MSGIDNSKMSWDERILLSVLAVIIAFWAGCTVQVKAEIETVTTTAAYNDGSEYSAVCRTLSEDSPIPRRCKLDPNARYDYTRGAWRVVPNDFVYANGNRPPTGRDLKENPPND